MQEKDTALSGVLFYFRTKIVSIFQLLLSWSFLPLFPLKAYQITRYKLSHLVLTSLALSYPG